MTVLSEYTPAEVIILTKRKATFNEFFKVTLAHLFLKEVLRVIEVERQLDETIRIYKYVEVGSNFSTYNKKSYENFFLSLFNEDESNQILFRNLIRIGYENSRNRIRFKNKILKTIIQKNCVSQNFFQKILGRYNLTSIGSEIKDKLEDEIKKLNNSLVVTDIMKTNEITKIIGGNIFFLEDMCCELYSQIDKDLVIEINLSKSEGDYDCT